MFKRFTRSGSDEAERRLASVTGRLPAAVADVPPPTPAAEFHSPPLPPDAAIPRAEPSDRVGTLRRDVQQRLEDEPLQPRPTTALPARLRGRIFGDSPDPLVIGFRTSEECVERARPPN